MSQQQKNEVAMQVSIGDEVIDCIDGETYRTKLHRKQELIHLECPKCDNNFMFPKRMYNPRGGIYCSNEACDKAFYIPTLATKGAIDEPATE